MSKWTHLAVSWEDLAIPEVEGSGTIVAWILEHDLGVLSRGWGKAQRGERKEDEERKTHLDENSVRIRNDRLLKRTRQHRKRLDRPSTPVNPDVALVKPAQNVDRLDVGVNAP